MKPLSLCWSGLRRGIQADGGQLLPGEKVQEEDRLLPRRDSPGAGLSSGDLDPDPHFGGIFWIRMSIKDADPDPGGKNRGKFAKKDRKLKLKIRTFRYRYLCLDLIFFFSKTNCVKSLKRNKNSTHPEGLRPL